MPRDFYAATAEQVTLSVECAFITTDPVTSAFVAEFADLPKDQAEAALKLAVDLGLLTESPNGFSAISPLCRYLSSPDQNKKAAVLRIVLESYHPFSFFRSRLIATGSASDAAQQTKAMLDITSHRESIKDTLLSLGTYSYALVTEGGGRYTVSEAPLENVLEIAARACADAASAEAKVRDHIGADATGAVSADEVIRPMSDALIRVAENDPRGAVVVGGNAIESFLDYVGTRMSVSLAGKTGINSKLDALNVTAIPRKLVHVGKYLGHTRNAADHGIDPDVAASWTISPQTAVEFVFVGCSFIRAVCERLNGRPPRL